MACFHPLKAYIGREDKVTFSLRDALCTPSGKTFNVDLPCGQCIGCRLERSRLWAIRCVHEASLYEDNCFITLTFSEDFPDKTDSLYKPDFQKFMKRLRRRFPNSKIRYFHCGEYGDKLKRPHHHACLFNFDFKDKELWTVREGVKLYRSKTLENLWQYGFSTIGEVNFDSCAYVARYIVKKITGDLADKHYNGKISEYTTMSRNPGIGKDWIKKYASDVYPHDFIVVEGDHKCKPPRYYDKVVEDLQNKGLYSKLGSIKKLKERREKLARENPDNSVNRLVGREKYTKEKLKRKERSYETEGVQSI